MDLTDKGESGPAPQDNADQSDAAALDAAIQAALDGGDSVEGAEARVEQPAAQADTEQDADQSSTDENQAGAQGGKGEESAEKASQKGQADDDAAPQHWPADRRKQFEGLPAEGKQIVKAFVKDLQGGFTKRMQEVSDTVKWAESVANTFSEHHLQQMRQSGLDEVGAIKHLLRLHDYAAQDPVGYVQWFVQQNPGAFQQAGNQERPEQDTQAGGNSLDDLLVPPEVKHMRADLQRVLQWQASQEQAQQERERLQVQQHHQQQASLIGQFRSSQDDNGNLAYPHFDRVKTVMGGIMLSDPRLQQMPDGPQKMDLAYRMAVMADPEIAESIIGQTVDSRVAEQIKAKEAAAVKRAVGPRPSASTPPSRSAAHTLDDAISKALEGAGQTM